jgi:hypothetical protein
MSPIIPPFESPFAAPSEAEAYDRWFRAKVQASLDDPRPSTPHDHVMAKMRQWLDARRAARSADGPAH